MNELERIRALPKREYTQEQIASINEEVTKQLKTPEGTQSLRPHQSLALYELYTCNGLVGAIRVGGGKTLISLLTPSVLDSRRAVLLLPAALIGKTERDKAFYAKHWQVCKHLRLMSYEMLGRTQSAQWLENFAPDLIIADECHRLKNPRAAVTKRVARYMQAHPSTRFIGLSGTIVRKSIKDYVHIANWALKNGSPLPQTKGDIDSWADALDAKTNPLDRGNPELLAKLGGLEGYQDRLIKTPGIIITRGNDSCDAALNISALRYEIAPQTQEHFRLLRTNWSTPCGWTFADPMEAWRHARELALGLHYILVDKDKYEKWLKSEQKNKRLEIVSTVKNIDVKITKKLEPEKKNTIQEILKSFGLRARTPTLEENTNLRGDTEFQSKIMSDYAPNLMEHVTSVKKSPPIDSEWITTTQQDELGDCFVQNAIRHSEHSAIPSKEYNESLITFIQTARPPQEWLQKRAAWAAKARQLIIRSRKYDSEKQVIDAVRAHILDIPEYWEWEEIRNTFTPFSIPVWHDNSAIKMCQKWAAANLGIIWVGHRHFAQELSRITGWKYFAQGGLCNGEPIEDTSPERDKHIIVSIQASGTGRNLQAWANSLITAAPSAGEAWEQLLGRTHRDGQKADEVNFDVFFACKEHAKSIDDALIDAEVISKREGLAQKLLLSTRDFPPAPEHGWQWGTQNV